MNLLYFDSLASHPLLPEAEEAMKKASIEHFANPSANHALGEEAAYQIEEVRELIADSIGALKSEIVFTSGATESNNLAIKSVILKKLAQGERPHIITSQLEHKCVLAICSYLERTGCEVTYLKPRQGGQIKDEDLANAFQENTALVSLMHVNNELLTINEIDRYGSICLANGVPFHSDVAQSYLKTPLDVDNMNLDFLSISAHKIGGPKGIGAAYIRDLRTLDIEPVIHGAGQEYGMRGGTLATPLILGFGAAVQNFESYYQKSSFDFLKKYLVDLLKEVDVRFTINGGLNTLHSGINLTFHNVDVEGLLRSTRNEFVLSQSSACSAGSIEASHVLTALGLNREKAAKTLRLSFTTEMKKEDIQLLVARIGDFLL